MYISRTTVYSETMETLPLNEDNFTLEDIYRILCMADESNEYRMIPTGRVTYYEFTILSDCLIDYENDTIAAVRGGVYQLVLDARTNEWVTLIMEDDPPFDTTRVRI